MSCQMQSVTRETIDILESFLDNIMIYNGDGVLLYSCNKFWDDTGLTPEAFAGKGIVEISRMNIYHPYCAEAAFLTHEKFTAVQKAFGEEITVATAQPIRDRTGNIFLIVAYAENNSRTIELEKKLAEANQVLREKNEELALLWNRPLLIPNISEESGEVMKIQKLMARIMDTGANVLLTGETGTGKTMFAKIIHSGSGRRRHPFVEINCAAIPSTLLESELFGYEKGAFTGAGERGKRGQIELAAKGTLFLDEISELGLDLQSKLLKVIQDKKIMPIGGTSFIDVDFRLIAASNKDLHALVLEGLFRADLFYRLNVIPIEIPPLRKRREDIPLLARHFLRKFNELYQQNKLLTKETLRLLSSYNWPGNVRELENTMERLVLTVDANEIRRQDLPLPMEEEGYTIFGESDGLEEALNRMEAALLNRAWEQCGGNVSRTARLLKLTRQSLMRRLEKHGIRKSGTDRM